MTEITVRKGFAACYEDGRDLRLYLPVATTEDKRTGGLSWASEMRWQRWYIEPGWYQITIEPWVPPGMDALPTETE
jgi:hypothetical protein